MRFSLMAVRAPLMMVSRPKAPLLLPPFQALA
jgi:hypothetical protein